MPKPSHQAALRDMEQHLYDVLRAGPGALWEAHREGADMDALRFAVECLSQLQAKFDVILEAHGIQPRSGPELEPALGLPMEEVPRA